MKLLPRLHSTIWVIALLGGLFSAAAALAQSDGHSAAGAAGDDLQLNAPSLDDLGIPSVDDAITTGAPQTLDIDEFLTGEIPPIPDPQRQPAPAAEMPADQAAAADTNAAGAGAAPSAETTAMKAAPDGAARSLEDRVARLERQIAAQSAKLDQIAAAQMKLQSQPNEQLKQIQSDLAALRQAIKSRQTVARVDPDGGADAGQPPQQPAEPPAGPKRGQLVVENLTAFGYTVNINGRAVAIWPGRQAFEIPIGPVVTEIRGFEAPHKWSAEDFRQVGDTRQLAIRIQ